MFDFLAGDDEQKIYEHLMKNNRFCVSNTALIAVGCCCVCVSRPTPGPGVQVEPTVLCYTARFCFDLSIQNM